MAKENKEDRKKEKKEKKEKREKKEKKRREAEELLAVKEKKISKKHKSESKKSEKPKKKAEVEEKPHKKSKDKKKKKHKKPDVSEDEPETETVRSDNTTRPVTVPTTTTNNNEYDSDFEFDKEDIKPLLESYTKEELVNLIYKTAEKGSRLISAVFESADRDSSKRNIFVRGLGWDTTHENLKSAFEVYGEIEECSVVMDKDTGRAKGYGFVMFKTRKGAREALRNPEKRMFNRNVSCNLAAAKPSGAGKPREPVESVKIDLTHTANQSEVVLPGIDLAHGHVVHGLDKGHQQQQNMPMYGGQNMPFYGHPGFNPMYAAALMGNQGPLMGNQMVPPGLPNYHMFGPGMMNQGPPNHMGMAGQYSGEGNGVGPGFDGERAWYLR